MKDLKYPIGTFDDQDPQWNLSAGDNIAYIAKYPQLLWATIANLTDHQMKTPYRPGGWTITQLIHHIADSHMNAYIRFKLSLTETEPTIKPYEEAEWAKLPDYKLKMISVSISLITALHTKWSNLMDALKIEDWNRLYRHTADLSYVDLATSRMMYHKQSAHLLAHIAKLVERES